MSLHGGKKAQHAFVLQEDLSSETTEMKALLLLFVGEGQIKQKKCSQNSSRR